MIKAKKYLGIYNRIEINEDKNYFSTIFVLNYLTLVFYNFKKGKNGIDNTKYNKIESKTKKNLMNDSTKFILSP